MFLALVILLYIVLLYVLDMLGCVCMYGQLLVLVIQIAVPAHCLMYM